MGLYNKNSIISVLIMFVGVFAQSQEVFRGVGYTGNVRHELNIGELKWIRNMCYKIGLPQNDLIPLGDLFEEEIGYRCGNDGLRGKAGVGAAYANLPLPGWKDDFGIVWNLPNYETEDEIEISNLIPARLNELALKNPRSAKNYSENFNYQIEKYNKRSKDSDFLP